MAFIPTFATMLVLDFLKRNQYNKIMQSISLQEIIAKLNEEDSSGKSPISDSMTRKAVDTLYGYGMIALGIKIGNSYTYYITPKGLEYLEYATTGKEKKLK